MTNATTFVTRHPVATYVALTFAISWGGFVVVVGPGGFPGTGSQFDRLLPFVASAMLAGPAVAGLLMTVLLSGTAGLRELLSSLLRWRVGMRWYIAALLPAPLLAAAVLFALSVPSPILTASDKTAILLAGIAAGLTTVFEEIGWTGFATPMLRRRYGVVTTGLIVGVIWGAWHLLQGLWSAGTYAGSLPVATFFILSFVIGAVDGVPGADALGLRQDQEPARRDVDARESHRQHGIHLYARGDRRHLLDLHIDTRGRDVGRRGSRRVGQQRAAAPATAPAANRVTRDRWPRGRRVEEETEAADRRWTAHAENESW